MVETEKVRRVEDVLEAELQGCWPDVAVCRANGDLHLAVSYDDGMGGNTIYISLTRVAERIAEELVL